MDQFKKHLREHRDDLDIEKPPSFDTWPVQSPVTQVSRPFVKWLAAALVVSIVSIMLFWMNQPSTQQSPKQTNIIERDTFRQITESTTRPDSLIADEMKPHDTSTADGPGLRRKIPAVTNNSKIPRKRKEAPTSFESLETNYATIINYQLRRLERTPIYAESADYFHVFKKQWYDLQKDEEQLKTDIQAYGLNDMIVDQVIQLYQNKISVLKQLQKEINKMNLRTRNHPDFQNKKPSYLKM